VTPSTFKKLQARDQRCYHCGETEAVSPNHRINRQMGGSKNRDQASNYVLICSIYNGLIESSAIAAAEAKRNGWKLESWQDPDQEPVYDRNTGTWWQLTDDYRRVEIKAVQIRP
jgi:hypothetical protein